MATKENKPETATETKDVVEALGRNLNLEKAKRLFGAEKAVEAMDAVAQAGRHGTFSEADYKNPLFGGLQIPDPSIVTGTTDDDNDRRKHYEGIRSRIRTALKGFELK